MVNVDMENKEMNKKRKKPFLKLSREKYLNFDASSPAQRWKLEEFFDQKEELN